MKTTTFKPVLFTLTLVISLLGATLLHISPVAHAATSSAVIPISIGSGCVSNVFDTSSTYIDFAYGSDVTLNVQNSDNVSAQTISGSGITAGTSVGPNTKTTNNQTNVDLGVLTSPVRVTFTPQVSSYNGGEYVNNCPTGSSPTSSSILVNPASATLSCSLQSKNWLLSGTFSGSSTGTGVFNGTDDVHDISSAGSFSQTVAASTSAQSFSVLDGLNYGGKGTPLASASCPAYVAPAAVSNAAPTTPNTASKTTTSTASTTATNPPTTTAPIKTPQTVTTTNSNHSGTTPAAQNTTIQVRKSNTVRNGSISAGVLLVLAIGIWLLMRSQSTALAFLHRPRKAKKK